MLYREISASESTKKLDGKENVVPHSNMSDYFNKSSSEIVKSEASCSGSARFTGNTWEEYFTATLEKSAESKKKDLHRGSVSAADMGSDKYSAIASLDDDLEEEKWTERTAVITALDHQVRLCALTGWLQYFVQFT